jgi:hypothetical protein
MATIGGGTLVPDSGRDSSHVLRELEGHLVSGYADGGDAPDKQLSVVPGALRKRRFTPKQIRLAADRLRSEGWLGTSPSAGSQSAS